MSDRQTIAVILAAGQGTRMKSDKPKVLHEICGRPMLAFVFDACRSAGVNDLVAIVGHKKELVIEEFADDNAVTWVTQAEQHGTGHAVMMAREQLAAASSDADVLILCGDGPLIRTETIRDLLARHRESGAAATLATAMIPDPTGYGRIWRDAEGRLKGIVEHRDCTPAQREIREVNPSYYCFRCGDLLDALGKIKNDNAKKEYYLTDTLAVLINAGKRVEAITAVPPEDIFSINSRKDLALVSGVMRDRINDALMDAGVTIIDPATTWVDARATVGPDTVLYPFTTIRGPARIGANCRIGPLAEILGTAVLSDNSVVRTLTRVDA